MIASTIRGIARWEQNLAVEYTAMGAVTSQGAMPRLPGK